MLFNDAAEGFARAGGVGNGQCPNRGAECPAAVLCNMARPCDAVQADSLSLFQTACARHIVRNALTVTAVAGTILNVIDQRETRLAGNGIS